MSSGHDHASKAKDLVNSTGGWHQSLRRKRDVLARAHSLVPDDQTIHEQYLRYEEEYNRFLSGDSDTVVAWQRQRHWRILSWLYMGVMSADFLFLGFVHLTPSVIIIGLLGFIIIVYLMTRAMKNAEQIPRERGLAGESAISNEDRENLLSNKTLVLVVISVLGSLVYAASMGFLMFHRRLRVGSIVLLALISLFVIAGSVVTAGTVVKARREARKGLEKLE